MGGFFEHQKAKTVLRKIRPIEYTNVKLDESNLKLETDYKLFRDAMRTYRDFLEILVNYEHGGKSLRWIKEKYGSAFNRIKQIEDEDIVDNFYDEGYQSTDAIAKVDADSSITSKAKRLSIGLKHVSKIKHATNIKLRELMCKLDSILRDIVNLDSRREDSRNERYDVEKLIRKRISNKSYNDQVRQIKEEPSYIEFYRNLEQLEKDMKSVLRNKEIANIIEESMKTIEKFHRESALKLSA